MTQTSLFISTEQRLQEALENCAREPIHIPGHIQPHGYLILVNQDFIVEKVSENILSLLQLPLQNILGKSLNFFISNTKLEELNQLLHKEDFRSLNYTTLTLKGCAHYFDVAIHQTSQGIILELEAVCLSNSLHKNHAYTQLMSFSLYIQSLDTPEDLLAYMATHIRAITGFARVKIYQFDANWDGTVVAESKAEHMCSYLGFRFPSSDIPPQARKLYTQNHLRLIPHVTYKAVPILPASHNSPLDLSFATLRSVANVHIQYLENMGVQASMSISILFGEKLWGLIACHHDTPFHVGYTTRMLCEACTRTFAVSLQNLEMTAQVKSQKEQQKILRKLTTHLHSKNNIADIFKINYVIFMKSVNADGIVLYINDKYYPFGMTPEISATHQLSGWLEKNNEPDIFYTDCISQDIQIPGLDSSFTSGALIAKMNTIGSDYIMWFRSEKIKHFSWAGKKESGLQTHGEKSFLTPRASFEKWQENIKGYSKPWTEAEIEVAKTICYSMANKLHEYKIHQQQEDFKTLLDNVTDAIYILDRQHVILSVNSKARTIFNLPQRCIGQSIQSVFERELCVLMKAHLKTVLAEQKSTSFEHIFDHKIQNYHLLMSYFPLYQPSGHIYAVCVIATDITHLTSKAVDLQTKTQVEQMSQIASHDLQEPLRMIASFSELFHKKYEHLFNEKDHKYMELIISATKRMQELINDLLNYAKVNRNKNLIKLDTRDEIQKIASSLEASYHHLNIRIIINDHLPTLYMVKTHFFTIIQNLLHNSIKYRHPDRQCLILVDCIEYTNKWVFQITDNGIGIEKEHFKKIFFIFHKLHHHKDYSGTGIGLAICDKIIREYGGSIWVDSEFGQGSKFSFSLPKRH